MWKTLLMGPYFLSNPSLFCRDSRPLCTPGRNRGELSTYAQGYPQELSTVVDAERRRGAAAHAVAREVGRTGDELQLCKLPTMWISAVEKRADTENPTAGCNKRGDGTGLR